MNWSNKLYKRKGIEPIKCHTKRPKYEPLPSTSKYIGSNDIVEIQSDHTASSSSFTAVNRSHMRTTSPQKLQIHVNGKRKNKDRKFSHVENIFLRKPEEFNPFLISEITADGSLSSNIFNKTINNNKGKDLITTNIKRYLIGEELCKIVKKTSDMSIMEESNIKDQITIENRQEIMKGNLNTRVQTNLFKYSDMNYIGIERDSLANILDNMQANDLDIKVAFNIREIICSFTQILEDFLCLVIETTITPLSYSLSDAFLKLKWTYETIPEVPQIVNKLFQLDIFCPKSGYIKTTTQPRMLMKAICCGFFLLQTFKDRGRVTSDTEEYFRCMLLRIETSVIEEIPLEESSEDEDMDNFPAQTDDAVMVAEKPEDLQTLITVIKDDCKQKVYKTRSKFEIYLLALFNQWKSQILEIHCFDEARMGDDKKVVKFKTNGGQ